MSAKISPTNCGKLGLLGLDFHYRLYKHSQQSSNLDHGHSGDPGVTPPPFGHAQRVYNVIDSRQAYLQNIVVQGLKALGYDQQAANSHSLLIRDGGVDTRLL